MSNRSEQLHHKPRGIKKWAPFNSLPEFTEKQKEMRATKFDPDFINEHDKDREYYFNDIDVTEGSFEPLD